ncbi:DEAD/DEAH box helicase family protein [Enterobacter hormaechei]|nr:DEAD/DEAH box helicase family protein [Enterobacter hormaechei]
MNRTITITRTESVKYIDKYTQEIRSTGQKVQNTYSQEWDEFCKVWGDTNNWSELDKNGKLQHTMFLGGACYTKRNDANTVFRSMFILDIDNQEGEELTTMEMVDEFLEGYDYFVYSTYSNTPEYPRFRVMLPLLDDVKAEDWKERQSDMKAFFSPIVQDTSCFTLSQGQIMPCYPLGKKHLAFTKRNQGVFFSLDTIPKVLKRDLVIDQFKTYQRNAYSDDTILDYVDCVSIALQGSLERSKAFMFACWCVANGINDPQYVERVLRYDANKTAYERAIAHMINASKSFMNYCGNNYHMGFYSKHLPADFWIKHAPQAETFKFDSTFDRFSQAKKEADEKGWSYYELPVTGRYGELHDQIDYVDGNNFLISDCGTGKSHTMMNDPMCIVLSPYTLLAEQTTKRDADGNLYPMNDIFYGSATYDQAEKLLNDHLSGGKKNKEALNYDYSKMTLVIDECHVLYNSSNFRRKAIRAVFSIMKLFKRVIFMSGTARPEYFSNVHFDKVIRVCKHYPFTKKISIFDHHNVYGLAYSLIQQSNLPGIILVNNKEDIEDIIKKYSDLKFKEITADTKSDTVIKDMIKRSTVDGSDYIIGTISVVEGLNFTDEFPEVNVFIIHTERTVFSTEQIEQVTNRWRNAEKINTYVFRHGVEVEDPVEIDFSEGSLTTEDFISLATENAEIANRKLSKAMDKQAFRNTYHNTCFSEMIRFDTTFNQYVPDYQLIDYRMYDIRRSNEQLDLQMYMFELECYGFQFCDTTYAFSLDIREEKAAQREAKKQAMKNAQETIVEKYDTSTGRFDDSVSYTNEEKKLRKQIQEILAYGVRDVVNDVVMVELPNATNPQKFLSNVKFDLQNKLHGNLITAEIKRLWLQVANGRDYILNNEKEVIAESVLRMIRTGRYEDQLHMAGGQYGQFVNDQGQLKTRQSADTFLKLFVCYESFKGTGSTRGARNIKFSRTGLI